MGMYNEVYATHTSCVGRGVAQISQKASRREKYGST